MALALGCQCVCVMCLRPPPPATFADLCSPPTIPQQREGQFSSLQLVAMQRGVAAAMQYLSSFAFVHRALSAHSVLVNSHLECKVSRLGRSPQVRAWPRGPGLSQGWGWGGHAKWLHSAGRSPQVRAQPRGPASLRLGVGGGGLPEDKLEPRVVDASGGEP